MMQCFCLQDCRHVALCLAYVHEGLDLHSGLGMAKGLWRAWPVTRWHVGTRMKKPPQHVAIPRRGLIKDVAIKGYKKDV